MKPLIAVAALCAAHAVAHGAEILVTMNAATAAGTGASAGTVRIVETPYGLAFYPALTGLPPGSARLSRAREAVVRAGRAERGDGAGDRRRRPSRPGRHEEARRALGRRPPRRPAGAVSSPPTAAPRRRCSGRGSSSRDVTDRALMIHAGGDNHADHPAPLGGGGGRIVCGVIGR